jgi:hypothetical protein
MVYARMSALRMDWKIILLSGLIAFLTGCAPDPPEKPATGPGLTYDLHYPVLLAGDRRLEVRDDKDTLITTRGASGLSFMEMKIIAGDDKLYEIRKVTPFGRKFFLMDLGTSPFQVYLELKRPHPITLQKAKALVMDVVTAPYGMVSDSANGLRIATERVQGSKSVADLIETCRTTWQWR